MRIFRKFQTSKEDSIVTIGNFDGMHLGHQKIFTKMNEISKNLNLKRILLTFEPHPYKIIKPHITPPKKIISLKEKIKFLQNNNLVDEIYLIKFNQNLKNIEAEDFIKNILVKKLKIKSLLIGYDFTFGKNKKGNLSLLHNLGKIYNFTAQKIPEEKIDHHIISSTKIRKYITEGKIAQCRNALGRNYQINGKVIMGQKLAQKIGFPTANIKIHPSLQQLKYGVYEVIAHISHKKLKAIANYGVKPTFNGKTCLCEVHIFDFDQDLYGQNLKIEFIRFVREEKKFSSVKELQKEIQKDCATLIS